MKHESNPIETLVCCRDGRYGGQFLPVRQYGQAHSPIAKLDRDKHTDGNHRRLRRTRSVRLFDVDETLTSVYQQKLAERREKMELLTVHPDTLVKIEAQKHHEAIQRAKLRHTVQEALSDQPSWTRKQSCWILCQLGRLLVSLGQQLERYGTPQTA